MLQRALPLRPHFLSFPDLPDSCMCSFAFQKNCPDFYCRVLSQILDGFAILIQSRSDDIIVENSIRIINQNPEGEVLKKIACIIILP
jgi:hypothetical protein